ncbi:MAG: NAD(P)H-hydrate epimerase [Candidatus Omnitrophota bacterium]
MRPVSALIMAEIDKKAQEEFGIPQSTLMENAGESIARTVLADTSSPEDERIAVLCGKGNNGGDGLVAARYLLSSKPGLLKVYKVFEGDMAHGAAEDNYNKAREAGVEIEGIDGFLSEPEKEAFSIIIDAVFGTGFKGELSEDCRKVFSRISAGKVKVYAVDVPSGLDATTGYAAKGCIKAFKTITFGLPKKGFFCGSGREFTGDVQIENIGFPMSLLERYQ